MALMSLFEYAAGISKQLTVLCDEKEMNYSLYHTICGNENLTICSADDPVKLMKSVKNEVETKNTYEAYLQDGIAEAEFYGWLYEALEKGEKPSLSIRFLKSFTLLPSTAEKLKETALQL